MDHSSPPNRPSSGVSLVEALIALAVMSFGMLALIGVQSTMRINTDLSRQTSEAARIAAADLESTRLFVDVRHVDAQPVPSWDDLAAQATTVTLPGDTGNVSYELSRTVTPSPTLPDAMARLGLVASQAKIIQSTVTWTDRTNETRTVRLQGMVSAAAPSLSGYVTLPPAADAPAQRNGRNPTIPVSARDLGNGKSVLKPSSSSTVVWVFNNATGTITQRCPSVLAAQSEISAETIASCPSIGNGTLLSGVVRFHLAQPPVGGYGPAQAEDPQGNPSGETLALASTPLSFNISNRVSLLDPPSECFAGLPYVPAGSSSTLASAIDYNCLIYYDAAAGGWGGKMDVAAAITGWSQTSNVAADSTARRYRVCRYTRSTSDFTANRDHPRSYCRVSGDTCVTANLVTRNLINQNFLVVAASGVCPTDSDNNSATGQDSLRNANTRAHQPS